MLLAICVHCYTFAGIARVSRWLHPPGHGYPSGCAHWGAGIARLSRWLHPMGRGYLNGCTHWGAGIPSIVPNGKRVSRG